MVRLAAPQENGGQDREVKAAVEGTRDTGVETAVRSPGVAFARDGVRAPYLPNADVKCEDRAIASTTKRSG